MNRIYGTYRMKYTNTGVRYSPSYFLDKQYEDYLQAGLTKTLDMEIGDDQYTAELAPGIKKMTRFIVGEYNPDYVDLVKFKENISKVGAEFGIELFATVDEAVQWLWDNTSLENVPEMESEGKYVFLLNSAYVDPISKESFPAKYLIVE